MAVRFAAWRERALQVAEQRLPALTRLKRSEPLPIVLDRRRIYVLPTRHGLFLAGILAAMTLGALNYNNNPALMLCFLVASAVHTSLLRGYLGLRNLRVEQIDAAPVHAGEQQTLRILFSATEPRQRDGLAVSLADRTTFFDLAPNDRAEADIARPARIRGRHAVGRLRLHTRRPLGLFLVWSWINPDATFLVYPALEPGAPPLPGRGDSGIPRPQRGLDEDLHSIRDYRSGDPLRLIAWKRTAQTGRVMVREHDAPSGADVLLDWHDLGAIDPERRIQRLARWIVEAERLGLRSTLQLPTERIGPDKGPNHVHVCLRQMALLP